MAANLMDNMMLAVEVDEAAQTDNFEDPTDDTYRVVQSLRHFQKLVLLKNRSCRFTTKADKQTGRLF
jgi:hypothetical protein